MVRALAKHRDTFTFTKSQTAGTKFHHRVTGYTCTDQQQYRDQEKKKLQITNTIQRSRKKIKVSQIK